jgi:SAM-dependent methyltransferase
MSIISFQEALAADLIRRYGLAAGSFVVEVGSGDGEFLRPFRQAGIRVLGIEPNPHAMTVAWEAGVDTVAAHFGIGVAEYVKQLYGPVRLLIARSVQAGSEEFARLIAAAPRCLAVDGVLAIQSAGINAFVEVRPDPPARHHRRAA